MKREEEKKREKRTFGKGGVFAWEFDADALYNFFFSPPKPYPPPGLLLAPLVEYILLYVLYSSPSSNLSPCPPLSICK